MTFTFEVTNTGDVDLTDVYVEDLETMSGGVPIVGSLPVDLSGQGCAGQALAVGETVTCQTTASATLGQHANQATAFGFYPSEEIEVFTEPDPATTSGRTHRSPARRGSGW